MKTHKVIDLVYHEDEGNVVFSGTHQECLEWKSGQGFGYQVVPMTTEEVGQLKESEKNEQDWFNSYQEIDVFLFEELEKVGKEFPIINKDSPELNTIEAIKILLNGG